MPGTRKRGMVFVTAIIALGLMMIVGVSFMSLSMKVFADAQREAHNLRATALAEAGLNYMIYLKQQDPSTTGITSGANVNFRALDLANGADGQLQYGADRAGVWIFTVPGNTSVLQVISKGYYRKGTGQEYERTARTLITLETNVTPPDPPDILSPLDFPVFDFAFFTDKDLDIKSQSAISGPIGSNSNITLKSQSSVLSSYYYITPNHLLNQNKNATLTGAKKEGPPLKLPKINFPAYKKYCEDNDGLIIEGNWNLPADLPGGSATLTFPPGKVIYVHGDISITSQVNIVGTGTIVCTGDLKMSSHVRATSTATSLFIAQGDVKVTSHVLLDAFVLNYGYYRQTAHVEVNGGIIANDPSFSTAQSSITYRRPTDDAVIITDDDDDDGDDGEDNTNDWHVVSWERL